MNLRKLVKGVLLPLFMLLSFSLFAQNRIISGRVTDPGGNGIPGVSVLVKGQSRGTTTGNDGTYVINVPSTATALIFSSVGYGTQEVSIEGRNTANPVLQSSSNNLNEVVVIGYGTRQRKDLTGSVTSITTKDFNNGTITTPEQLIAGKVAGVQITTNSGAPGSGSTIRIRGGASLSASNDPLIVVDGVPLDNTGISGSANALSLINPDDIESMNILKDASAAAIYGSRASNGVIIITTKKGRTGKPHVSFTSRESVSTNPKQMDVLSASQLRDLINKSGNAQAKALLGNANTNWQNQIYQNALTEDNNLSVSGSAGKMPYRLSGEYLNQDGILKTDNLKRTSASVYLSPRLFQDHLKIDVNLRGAINHNRFANQGAIGSAAAFDPTQPVYSGNNRFGGFFEWVDPSTNKPNTLAPRNPLALLMERNDKSTVQRSIGNVQFDYKFHFLPDLHANLNLGYDISDGKGTVYVADSAASNYARGGINNQYHQKKSSKLWESYLSYNKDIASISSHIDAVAGYSYQDYRTTNYFFADYNAAGVKQPNSDPKFPFDIPENTLISFYGRVNYGFKDKYLLTASLRRDGSSRFSPNNRWGMFPAVALAWRIKDENFLKHSATLSDLKLRAGYGLTGQQDIGLNYSYLGVYSLSTQTASYQLGNTFYPMYRPAGYNPNLKWEQTATYNAGLDFGLISNRITGSVDVYYKNTTNLLNNINQPAGANFSNVILANVGSMENKGVEFNINASPIRRSGFNWDVNFNITYNQNKITKLTAVSDPNYPGVQFGGIAGGVGNQVLINSVGYNRGAFYVYQQVYDKNGKPIEGLYVDQNGDGVINEKDLYRYKSADPRVFLGFSTNLNYGKWTGAFTLRANLGNYLYNNVYSNGGVFHSIYDLPNFLGNANVSYLQTGFLNNQYLSDYYIQNASFLRMDNIMVGYKLGKVFNQHATLNLNATVQNVFVITQYKGMDPEINGGIDNNFYPRPRVYTMGLNLNF